MRIAGWHREHLTGPPGWYAACGDDECGTVLFDGDDAWVLDGDSGDTLDFRCLNCAAIWGPPDPSTRRFGFTMPLVSFDLESGADWGTLVSVVNTWYVRVELCDGSTISGLARYDGGSDIDTLDLWDDMGNERIARIDLDHVYRIVVL